MSSKTAVTFRQSPSGHRRSRRTIRFCPVLPTLRAKAEVALSEANGFPRWQPKAVINLALPADDNLSGPAIRALVREEVIRVLRGVAEATEASRDSSPDACEPHDRVS
ncbi:hypothetical protein [Limimaricola soesokkakensis]|uniref:hypothetical protein n=1 Tax=Limimaricola soesokkakensis TaxID=1343159 RepID=UPI0035189A27